MNKLIPETGKVKLKGFDYPVHIYATNGGACGDLIFGAYKNNSCGWKQITWNKNGTSMLNMASLSLVPVPPSQYFNIYTDADGDITNISKVHHSLESALARKLSKNGTTYKYTDGVIEKLEEPDNEN